MNELELYVDSLPDTLSNEEKVRLVEEWKKNNKWGEPEVVEEVVDSGESETSEDSIIEPGKISWLYMNDKQLQAAINYRRQYEVVAKTNEVYSPEGDDYEYKFSVNEQGGLDYLTKKKGEKDFIKADKIAEISIADTFGHLSEEQKTEFENYKKQLSKIQEKPGTVTLIETDPSKKNLAVRAEDGGFYVPQIELPKASNEDAIKNFEKRTGKKPSSLMELTD